MSTCPTDERRFASGGRVMRHSLFPGLREHFIRFAGTNRTASDSNLCAHLPHSRWNARVGSLKPNFECFQTCFCMTERLYEIFFQGLILLMHLEKLFSARTCEPVVRFGYLFIHTYDRSNQAKTDHSLPSSSLVRLAPDRWVVKSSGCCKNA